MSEIGETLAQDLTYRSREGIRVIVPATGKAFKSIISEAIKKAIDKIKYAEGTLTEMKPIDFTKKYHGRAMDSVVIPDKDVLAFKQELCRYGTDFAVFNDSKNLDEYGKPKEYEILFMGSNINQIHKSLEKVFGDFAEKLKPEHDPLESVQLKDAFEKVGQQVERIQEHEKSGRGAR